MSDDYPGTRSGRDVVYDYAERIGRWAPQAEHDPRPPTEAPGRVAGVLVCRHHAETLRGLQTAHGSVESHARRVAQIAASCLACLDVAELDVTE